MRCLTHKQVEARFRADLMALCMKHNVSITSESDIMVEIQPVYDRDTNLYCEYGADFSLGKAFTPMTVSIMLDDGLPTTGCVIRPSDFPKHTR